MPPTPGKTKNENRIVICHASRKRDGQRCTRLALEGEQYCWQHSPSFMRKLRNIFLKIGGVVGILAITSLVLNLFAITDRIFPRATPSSTLTPTPLPRADKLYFTFLVDASDRMLEIFDGTKTKWDSVQESALSDLVLRLPARANFGLIFLGGITTGNNTNCDTADMVVPLRPDNRDSLGILIENQHPQGVTSLAKAIDLARNRLLELPDDSTVRGLELFVFLGGGDGCSNNDLRPLLYFLQDSAKYLTNTHVELFILTNETIDNEILGEIEKTNQEIENVRVKITTSAGALKAAVNQSYAETKERAREVEPSAVAAQETIVVQNLTSTVVLTTNTAFESETPNETQIQIVNTFTPTMSVTPSPSPTFTASITLSPIPTPIPPTQIPPTPIPATPIPPPTYTPVPVVVLLSASYQGSGEGCSALITYEVRDSPATGEFHVWNAFYGQGSDTYPVTTLPVGISNYRVGLGGKQNPAFYTHKVWFEYNGISSNVLDGLICPGLTPSP